MSTTEATLILSDELERLANELVHELEKLKSILYDKTMPDKEKISKIKEIL